MNSEILSLQEIARKSPLSLNQLKTIEAWVIAQGNFTDDRVRREIAWFCLELGIADYYFKYTSLEDIGRQIESLLATKIIMENSGGQPVATEFIIEHGESGTYMVEDNYGPIRSLKARIESHYPVYRLQSYRCQGYPLRFYVAAHPHFDPRAEDDDQDFILNASREFLQQSPRATIDRYRRLWTRMRDSVIPRISFSQLPKSNETRIMVGMGRDAARGFFVNYTFILKKHCAHINREYVEPFADGKVIFSFYLDRLQDRLELDHFFQDITMAALISPGPLSELFYSGEFSAEEEMYATAATAFAHQFLTSYTEEYSTLTGALTGALTGNPELLGTLDLLKTRLAKDTYHEERVIRTVMDHQEIVRELFHDFFYRFFPGRELITGPNRHLEEAKKKIEEKVSSEIERHILEAMILFNGSVLKTNFFTREKVCLAFRLSPDFLNPVDYPEKPYGVFFLIGKGFRGFHIRFREIGRGGIRLVCSPTKADYDLNSDFIFDENYNLALTQQKKNKDIPEGGAKGAILPALEYSGAGDRIFRHYIDGLLDLLLLPNREIVDYHGKEEILFLGPDEGTAELMDWAARYARSRGYRWWRSFATGKGPQLGGIPHDTYGMTTQSIHQYVIGSLRALGRKEEKITKFQTGGPDGDLGSNEILISRDRTVAVVDGSGVAYDPEGLDRRELRLLARRRDSIAAFRREKLSKRGFLVKVEDRDIRLPDGTVVANGTEFRNRFHFYPGLSVDLFIPCGGRPRAINIDNWRDFLDEQGRPRAEIIVEGANLFITQEARLRLEENGVILFKDATANKGGVTSSSFEVLAALALSDEEYGELMAVSPEGEEPEFRKQYISEILEIIRRNAAAEFELLWQEHQDSGTPLATLSDRLSDKINRVTDQVALSELFEDPALRETVILHHCPPSLVKRLSLKKILSRVPDNYLRAVFASFLASSYVYQRGLNADELDFYAYVVNLGKR